MRFIEMSLFTVCKSFLYLEVSDNVEFNLPVCTAFPCPVLQFRDSHRVNTNNGGKAS
jgi:hypothetical protein